ncbi:MAG: hypothetical protein DMG13_00310 [Acidobacteria bacterium]|nr:MAG: hypothetical protein DMG13_00310 [Acidobacteriota bacterium]
MTTFGNQPARGGVILPPIVYVNEKIVWQYKQLVRNLSKESAPAEEELNSLGKQGWELVGIVNDSPLAYFYFKRMKP